MKNVAFLFPTFILFCFIFIPQSASAALPFVTCDGYFLSPEGACDFCNLVEMTNRIIGWLIGVLFVIFAAVMVVAGFKLVTSGGNQSVLDSAKSMFTNAIIGLIIVFAAWLLVDTLMKALVSGGNLSKFGAGFGPWNEIKCAGQFNPNVGIARRGDGVATPGTATTPPGTTQSDAIARQQLTSAGIAVVSTGSCADKTQSNCTSLDGISSNAITDAINLKQACNCDITITGGTEVGHAATGGHSDGIKYDIRLNPTVDAFITSNYTDIGRRSDGAQMYQNPATGYIYAKERDHWDIKVN